MKKILVSLFAPIFLFISFSLSSIEFLVPQVIRKIPHDDTLFTQGLAIHDGLLYESGGLYGLSSLRKLDLLTGQVLKVVNLPKEYFGEGIAIFDNKIYQLTWKEKTALCYNLNDLVCIEKFFYQGEGWGLCRDNSMLLMTQGTDKINRIFPNNFDIQSTCSVKINGQELELLNDLECVAEAIYANILGQDMIARIDKKTGIVTGLIDASSLLTNQEKKQVKNKGGVMNGIAYNEASRTFFITGKYWPWLFEVKFIPKK